MHKGDHSYSTLKHLNPLITCPPDEDRQTILISILQALNALPVAPRVVERPVRPSRTNRLLMPSVTKQTIWVLEDNAHCSARDVIAGVTPPSRPQIVITLHRISRGKPRALAKHQYRPGSIRKQNHEGGRAQLALALIQKVKPKSGLVVTGT